MKAFIAGLFVWCVCWATFDTIMLIGHHHLVDVVILGLCAALEFSVAIIAFRLWREA
jgi:hypothetical protein